MSATTKAGEANDLDFHLTISTCTAFIRDGMNDNDADRYRQVLNAWGEGALELAQKAAGYAILAASVVREVDRVNVDAFIEFQICWPGVYEYEVCEPFGKWFADHLVEKGDAPSLEESEKTLLGMVREFFEIGLLDVEKDDLAPRLNAILERAMRSYSGGDRGYQPGADTSGSQVRRVRVFRG